MKYIIKTVEEKVTSTGKPMFKVTMTDESGKDENLNMFDPVKVGDTVEGETYTNDKGYLNFKRKLEPPEFIKKSSGYKEKIMEKAMERKENGIEKFQDNKEWSIKVASTMNKAVELAIAEIKDIKTLNTLENDILKWREWLWNNWDVASDQYPPFK